MDPNVEEFKILKELMALDFRRKDLTKRAAEYPAEIAKRQEEVTASQAALAAAEAELEKIQKERRRLEAALSDKRELLKKYQSQLDTVKTNKEYQSLLHEIELTRTAINAAEDELLEVMDQMERLQKEFPPRRAEHQALQERVAAADAEARARLADIEVQLVEVEEKRKRLLPQLSPALRSEYQRVFEHYRGDAFAVARNGVCQGCFVNIPAKVVAELQAGDKLYRCESCGRFILCAEDEWQP